MKKELLLFLIWIFFAMLTSQALAEVNLTKLSQKTQPAVVTVITYDQDKNCSAQGSGFFIDERGHLITNYHVLKGAHSGEVKTFNGKKYPIKLVIADNKTMDLVKVFVEIPKESIQWIEVVKDLPDIAERVLVIGSPMGLEQTVSEGIVSAVREIPNMGKIFQISAPISAGSSGSPVVNMKGEAIGVATFYLVKGQNINFAVPGKYILDLKPGKTISEWTYCNCMEESEICGKQETDMGVRRLSFNSVTGSFVDSKNLGSLFVIRGMVVNEYSKNRSFILLKGSILDDKGQVVKRKLAYVGNNFKEEEIKLLPLEKINKAMKNRYGMDRKNVNIAPGTNVPFTIVFENLPKNLSEFTVEAVSSSPGSGPEMLK